MDTDLWPRINAEGRFQKQCSSVAKGPYPSVSFAATGKQGLKAQIHSGVGGYKENISEQKKSVFHFRTLLPYGRPEGIRPSVHKRIFRRLLLLEPEKNEGAFLSRRVQEQQLC
jgi:hypothetical protein